MKSIFIGLVVVCLLGLQASAGPVDELASAVKKLGLGADGFVIGSRLTEEQIASARGSLLDGAYPGTIKFPSGDIVVVADEDTYLVLAVFQRREDACAEDVKLMIGHLMTRFGVPTTMAHGKLIYWAFNEHGKIEDSVFQESRATGEIDILATVKFNSSLPVSPGMDNENTEETGSIYYIITSDRLLSSFTTEP